jgi:pyridoxal phosphate enzyme (YggS family)
MTIAEKIRQLRKDIPSNVKIIVISKTRSVDEIMEAYHAGQRIFGENKARELVSKQALLPSDIEWHFIGHLQTNKVKYIVPVTSMIQSIDSLKLLKMVNREAQEFNRSINCLLQFHIATEETKFGLDLQEAIALVQTMRNEKMKNVSIHGVMGMATYSDDQGLISREFQMLKSCFSQLKRDFFSTDQEFKEISMGMSGDYLSAIHEGSTMIRVGTVIFGERNYR